MLYLIGIGLNNEKDISINGLEVVKKSDFVYLENYTSKLSCSFDELEKLYGKKIELIDESYNANPNSVRIAINNFNKIEKKHNKKILLLGDMLELGEDAEIEHTKLGSLINKTSDIDCVLAYGNLTKIVLDTIDNNKIMKNQ